MDRKRDCFFSGMRLKYNREKVCALDLLYEDASLAVCFKPAGVAAQESAGVNLPALLRAACGCEVYPVHRLDLPACGVMVFAKTPAAAAALGRQFSAGAVEKEYLCAVHGVPAQPSATLEDLLFRDGKKNKTYVVDRLRKGVKPASLDYWLVQTAQTEAGAFSLLRVRLHTGRTHQIRAQFASRGLPLAGDGKYGAADRIKALALCSCRLVFRHPETGALLHFSVRPPEVPPWNWFSEVSVNE